MEIDFSGLTRVVRHLDSALNELRSAIRPDDRAILTLHTDGQMVELPIGFVIAALLAAAFFFGNRRRSRNVIIDAAKRGDSLAAESVRRAASAR